MELANGVPEDTEETAVTPTNTGFSHPPTETEEAVAVNDERDNKTTKDMSWASKLKVLLSVSFPFMSCIKGAGSYFCIRVMFTLLYWMII